MIARQGPPSVFLRPLALPCRARARSEKNRSLLYSTLTRPWRRCVEALEAPRGFPPRPACFTLGPEASRKFPCASLQHPDEPLA